MSRTRMGPAACVVLSGALKDNTMIERLLLHDNPLGEVGAWHLMAAITANKNLEYIGLQGSNFISTGQSPAPLPVASKQREASCKGSHCFLHMYHNCTQTLPLIYPSEVPQEPLQSD